MEGKELDGARWSEDSRPVLSATERAGMCTTLIVFTGLSCSGKSSLVFDTIYAEGQRRYIESLSSYARQFLGQMPKPNLESIEGLTPTIAIQQRTSRSTPRSTVATTTEIHDYLRVLYARAGKPHCPICNQPIQAQSVEDISQLLQKYPDGTKIQILSPVVRKRKGEYRKLLLNILSQGFERVRINNTVFFLDDLENLPKLQKNLAHNIEVLVDQLSIKKEAASRISESLEIALQLSQNLVLVCIENLEDKTVQEHLFSENFACPEHGSILEELSPRAFSFNTPFGACETCNGLGVQMKFDEELLIKDPSQNVANDLLATGYMGIDVVAMAEKLGHSEQDRWQDLPTSVQQKIFYGVRGERIKIKGRKYPFEGIIPCLERRLANTDSNRMREFYQRFMKVETCPSCEGKRLKKEMLAVKIDGLDIAAIAGFSIEKAHTFFQKLKLQKEQQQIAEPILKAILERLEFLQNVGLNYLTLDRATMSLSGGEAQRIKLASQLGAKLAGVTYVLDEPTIGLHQRDNLRLLNTLISLRDLGNTILVVEHDQAIMESADYLVDIGPKAGKAGGFVVSKGTPTQVKQSSSLTADYLCQRRLVNTHFERRKLDFKKCIQIQKATENNLKQIDAKFPLQSLICVTGVSGSGKSSLVNNCLLHGLQKKLGIRRVKVGAFKNLTGVEYIDKIIHIDQSPIGRTSRSNPATYSGLFDPIRQLFATTPTAKAKGYNAGRFSFNTKGGRCEACQGQGSKTVEMHFLPNIDVVCESCKGSRYNQETLQIRFKQNSIADVLNMSVAEALEFFTNQPKIANILRTMNEVGLDYLHLGQPSPSLSGGEAQRMKLAAELSKRQTGKTLYVMDEPTTGLHFDDIACLLRLLQKLVELGNTVIIIEHNLDVIQAADWVLDLGPEGGNQGGEIIACGTPEQIAKNSTSYTGQFLNEMFLNHNSKPSH